MKQYKVNEIFYSIQAEGLNAGMPAIFVRLSGCNLQCPFCDTNHEPYRLMTKDEIEREVNELDKDADEKASIVITGGEPTLQLTDDEPMFKDRFVAMETNGIIPPPRWIFHRTLSPKTKENFDWDQFTELKVLMGWFDEDYVVKLGEEAWKHCVPCYMQPTADKDGKFDVNPTIDFCKRHPGWNMSIQFHKLLNIR